ncbi:hypothetical protein MTO96_008115 [Rhipicephalus appendiculatus]
MECAANQLASFFMPRIQCDSGVRSQLAAILKRLFMVLLAVDLYQFWPSFCQAFFSFFPFTSSGKMNNVIKELDNFIMTEEDVMVDNIFVPRGTVVLFNLWAVSRDPSLWKNPHRFDPTRYLRDDGSLIREKPAYHVGFSYGEYDIPGINRHTEKDVVVDNILIPGGSVVLFNLWAVNRDPSLWKNPHHYDPTRFLREDGSLIPEKPGCHVGFSFGKRSCPGEPFTLMQIFLMVTYTLQRYNVELGEPLTCDLDDPAVDLGELKKMRLRFERRFRNTITFNGEDQ